MMAREEWRAREDQFSELEGQIEQLEQAGHPKASALREVANRISNLADGQDYKDALTGLDRLAPKANSIYREHSGQGEATADQVVPPAPNDLSNELATAEDFIALWNETLEDVAGQVEALRNAMQGNPSPRVQSIYEGLATVMQKFPDLDLSKLVDAARRADRKAYTKTLMQTRREVQQVRDLLAHGPLLGTIDKNPFYRTNVHATVLQNLNVIAKVLRV